MKSLPRDVAVYRQTPEFTESSIPAGLLRSHTTKAGVWGRIRVLEGSLLYRILEPVVEELLLEPGVDGIVQPGIEHQVEACGPTRFFVEFMRSSRKG